MASREPADDEKTHPLGGFGRHLAAEREPFVRRMQVLRGHAESPIGHLDQDAGVDRARDGDRDRRFGRRIPQGVVEQLRDQVADITRRRADDRDVAAGTDLDPPVLLDLGHRGAQHFR